MKRPHRGNVSFMRPVKGYMAAIEIAHLCPLPIRIDEIFVYDVGDRPMGRPLTDPMTTMEFSVRAWDSIVDGVKQLADRYSKAPKEWILNGGIQTVLTYRHGLDTGDWIGNELELHVEVTKSAKGGLTYGTRIVQLPYELDHDEMHRRMLGHLPYQPPTIKEEPAEEPAVPHKTFGDAGSWAASDT